MVRLLIKHLPTVASKEITDTMTRISGLRSRDIVKEVKAVEQCQSRNGPRRVLGASRDEDEPIRRYRRIEQLFRLFQGEASMSMWNDTKRHFVSKQLENLGPVKLAGFNSRISEDIGRRSCARNTRTQILHDSVEWADNLNGTKIYWMNGMAGTGKTTIAYSLCERLDDTGQLAASFFCTRTSRECSEARRIFPTIAYQLARYSVPFRDALCGVLDKDPDVGNLSTTSQFRLVLAKPLLEAKEKMSKSLIVVIDALDECNDPHPVKDILDILFQFAADLPIKFFVTSRLEPTIRDSMMSRIAARDCSGSILYLHEIEKSPVQADIELYLKDELQDLLPAFCADIEELAEQAGNLFIYAATAVRYIQAADKIFGYKRLKIILEVNNTSKKGLFAIDALYSAILSAAIHDNTLKPEERGIIRVVLWTAVCICEPVLTNTLAALAGLDDNESTISALQPLRSVLRISEHNNLVATLHASFPDFIFSKERSQEFFCDRSSYDQFLARRCLEIMGTQLRFNICKLGSSFILDDEVSDFKERVEAHISPELFYACRFWAGHLTQGPVSLVESIYAFLSQRLLFWMEVLNLRKLMVTGAMISAKVHMWLRTANVSPDMIALARDAQIFVGNYATHPVSASTPHIYLSALPLSSPTNLIRLTYLPRFAGLVQVSGSLMKRIDQASLDVWLSRHPIRSASFSTDREHVALGDDHGTISVRDAHGGEHLVTFRAHRKAISSIAFSSDATLIASSSHDHTLCLWRASNGSLVSGPFKGHNSRVNSVSFSPDGMHLVSGSEDWKVRTWATSGILDCQLLLAGHAGPVRSVVFSHDGMQIASGSSDHTVIIWDAIRGTLLRTLRGHIGHVPCVQFSACGTFVVSGSNDCTIRMWDTHNGTPIGNPLQGHSHQITSIAVSPEGERIVSGSCDRTVRVWHIASGELIAGPFEGHTDIVRSVRFSADGLRIISASDDKTVRVWNAQGKAQCDANHSFDKLSGISSTTIPSDGAYIASGHGDGSIRAWHIQSGSQVWVWHLHHAKSQHIVLLTFSPDSKYILVAYKDGVSRVLSVQTGKLVGDPRRFSPRKSIADYPAVLSSDGKRALGTSSVGGCRVLDLWDLQANRLVSAIEDDDDTHFRQARFVANDVRIATCTNTGRIDFWDSYTGRHTAGPFHLDPGSTSELPQF
ncbi:unnamed protein product [Rhizoctonia solani]|uniref:Nephrocystin 3-like N-terminal domain-containing protein n=1 Tax=Rhizoctonia solani TaxID=456999 RepID=A0A8H3DLX7_9AGAM|nr:unnamed protein product [Rhizoctonia solani]